MSLPEKNLLAAEASPYLRQHRDNPVHWRAWNPASLAEARESGKPILLSIGYAACHWCHVMAHESFENPDIAAQMNRLFVNIKVDREERPDIDQVFMAALSATGEQGGWPLTMFLTPDGQPFWGGTYFPPAPRYGRPGFPQVLDAVAKAWRDQEVSLRASAEKLISHVKGRLAGEADRTGLRPGQLEQLAQNVLRLIDLELGGLRGAPKFPNAPFMQTLWLDWLARHDPAPRDAFLISLRKMLDGGIYDHIGGGLCRYSTDAEWMIPHFEKMLYDNAQLVRQAGWAFAATGDEVFRDRIESTITWLLREMVAEDGAFTASHDADSEGEEGRFYTWTPDALADALGDTATTFHKYYGLGTSAHWEADPVIFRKPEPGEMDPADASVLTHAFRCLMLVRDRRQRPGRDDKIVVDWNGLAITAIAEAGRVLARPEWIAAAERAYAAILARRDASGRLPHAYLGQASVRPALSIDYAAMINAGIALAEATQNHRYLADARGFAGLLQQWHADPAGFMLTAADAVDVPLRIRGDVDEAIPSATSQIVEALARLATATGDEALREMAWNAGEHAAARAEGQAYGQAGIVNANAILLEPRKLVIIEDPVAPALVSVANRNPDPRRVDVFLTVGGGVAAILADGSAPPTDRPAAYLCVGPRCLTPITDPEKLQAALSDG